MKLVVSVVSKVSIPIVISNCSAKVATVWTGLSQRSRRLILRSAIQYAWVLSLPIALLSVTALPTYSQVGARNPLTVRADRQEADARTGIVTARGNVQIDYPARAITGTADQVQYFSNERRLVMTGNVFVLQDGNSIRGEVVVYLIDEGKFMAEPLPNRQVESVYLVPAGATTALPAAPALPPVRSTP